MKPAQKLIIPQDRNERLHYIKRIFSEAKGADLQADWAGGRFGALKNSIVLMRLLTIETVIFKRFSDAFITIFTAWLRNIE